VWLVLDGPALLRSAQDAPLGTRRTVAITVLRPIAAVSHALGLAHVVGEADRAIGRTGNTGTGVLQVEGPPAHRHRAAPRFLAPSRRHRSRRRPRPRPRRCRAPSPAITVVTRARRTGAAGRAHASAPLRLLVLGDSLGIDFGQPLVNDLAATDVVSAVLDGHIDTGLSRPDYFNWQTELQHDLTSYQPQAIVVFIGANDPQNFMDGSTSMSYGHPGVERRLRQARRRLHGAGGGLGGPGLVDRHAAHGRSRPQRQDGGPQRRRPRARRRRTRA